MIPLVSIIVPVYNTAAYLRRCLDSACNQTYNNIEIICVNDGSTDNSLDILNEYAYRDPRVKVVTTKNMGLGAARNVGLTLVKGVWITGLDSDDYLELDACAYAISHAAEDVEVIQVGLNMKEDGKPDIRHTSRIFGRFAVTPESLIDQPCEFCGKFWRKAFLDKHKCRFPEGLWYEDWFFYWAYLPLAQGVIYLPACKYVYVRRAASIMGKSNNNDARVLNHIQILKLLLHFRSRRYSSSSFSSLNPINFIQCWRFIEPRISDSLAEKAIEMFETLVDLPILKPWIKWLNLSKNINISRLSMVKRELGLIQYGFWGFYPLSVGIERDHVVWRLLGRRFVKYKLRIRPQ